jgi:hypothetical protein
MKISTINFSLFLLFSFSFLTVKAQSEPNIGYYITNTNDTVKALFKDDPQKKLTYQVSIFDSINRKWINIYPEQIKQFYMPQGERLYESKQLVLDEKPTNVFLRCLVDGSLRLYSFNLGSNQEFYLMDSTLIKLEYSDKLADDHSQINKKYLGQLKYAMRDKPGIFEDLNKTRYRKKELMQLFGKFNSMTEKDFRVYDKSRVVFSRNIQAGGLITTHIRAFSFSCQGEVYDPDISKYSSLRFDLSYSQVNNYQQEEFSKYYDYTYGISFDDSFKSLSLSYNYQYKFYNKIVDPYIYIGVSMSIFNYRKDAEYPGFSQYIRNKYRHQFVYGIGLERYISNNLWVYTELRKEIIGRMNIGLKYKLR